jgi:hypothetical protein
MNEYLAERAKWWPVSSELMAQYKDGSHTEEWNLDTLAWLKNGVEHRDGDKPALIYGDGSLTWFKHGVYHRDGDKPARIWANGPLKWAKNGKWHRDGDKPAYIHPDGSLVWYKNGLRHRITGPAIIRPNNKHEYWINGVNITEEVESWLRAKKYTYPFTPEQQAEFTLTFG